MRQLWKLFYTFAKIGVCTFGGGYAMLPMLQREVVNHQKWATEDELMDYFAIGQCTPGVIAVNTATFIGYKKRGVLGAACATAGVIFPSLVIVMVIAAFLQVFAQLAVVQQAFGGIRVVVGVLILNAVKSLWKKSVVNGFCAAIAAASFVISGFFSVSPIILVVAGILLGLILMVVHAKKDGKGAQPK